MTLEVNRAELKGVATARKYTQCIQSEYGCVAVSRRQSQGHRLVRDPLTAHSLSFLNVKGNKAERTKQTADLIRFFPLRYSLVRDHLTLGGWGRGERERYLCVRKSGLWVLKKIYT